jgi:hypothetical protein
MRYQRRNSPSILSQSTPPYQAVLLYFYMTLKKKNMETQTASTRTKGLLTLFDYHSGFFAKALEGISSEDMHNRLNTQFPVQIYYIQCYLRLSCF